MKAFAVLLIVAIIGCLTGAKPIKDALKAANEKCDSDPATAVDAAAFKAWKEKTGPRPENMGAHTLCLSKELKLQNADGTVNTAFIKEKLQEHASEANGKTADGVLSECAVQKQNDFATAEHLLKCLIFDHLKAEKKAAL